MQVKESEWKQNEMKNENKEVKKRETDRQIDK